MASTGNARRDGGAIGNGPAADGEFDPFADLARLLEEPWTDGSPTASTPSKPAAVASAEDGFEEAFAAEFSKVAPGRKAYEAGPAAAAPRGFESSDDFVAALRPAEARASAPATQASYAGWVGAKPAEPPKAAAKPAAKPASGGFSLEAAIEEEIEDAIRGLSAPANPRGTTPHRSESFAPERRVVHEAPVASNHEAAIDDFDALIASELAVLQDRNFMRSVDHAVSASASGSISHETGRDVGAAAPMFHTTADTVATERRARRSTARMVAKVATVGTGLAAMVAAGLFVAGLMPGSDSALIGGGEPLLVKADVEPFKIVPENPGGRSIPNQNKAVYTRVQSAAAPGAPAQQELRVEAEEPMELAPEDDGSSIAEDLPGVSFYDDGPGTVVASSAEPAADTGPVLQPRRVRALTVRPDGTLVTEADPSAPTLENLQNGQGALVEAAARPVQVASADPAAAAEALPAPVRAKEPSPMAEILATAPAAPAADALPPAAETPAEPLAVASVEPAAAPAATYGGYYVQISSQPSAEAAQSSSNSMRSKYASVLDGREVVIQAAEIPGKGTYHRVRVLAGSQNEASGLCEALKSAGGSCFVSR